MFGSTVVDIDGGGTGWLTLPVAFPNRFQFMVASNGDFNYNMSKGVQTISDPSNGGTWINVQDARGNDKVRINYIAYGW